MQYCYKVKVLLFIDIKIFLVVYKTQLVLFGRIYEMSLRDEACERLLENIEDAINSLERGKEECAVEKWELFPPEEIEEIVEKLRDMASKLNIKISEVDDIETEE